MTFSTCGPCSNFYLTKPRELLFTAAKMLAARRGKLHCDCDRKSGGSKRAATSWASATCLMRFQPVSYLLQHNPRLIRLISIEMTLRWAIPARGFILHSEGIDPFHFGRHSIKRSLHVLALTSASLLGRVSWWFRFRCSLVSDVSICRYRKGQISRNAYLTPVRFWRSIRTHLKWESGSALAYGHASFWYLFFPGAALHLFWTLLGGLWCFVTESLERLESFPSLLLVGGMVWIHDSDISRAL